MSKSIKCPELLSPAGDMSKLKMAVLYGADAVYLAGPSYGMRGGPANFSLQELPEAVAYAHKHQVKVHVTINIMPRNDQIAALPEYLEYLDCIGVDALIIADLGSFELAKKYAPHCERHISTQVSVVNYETAAAWHALGAKRVVLARELSLKEIETIRNKTPDDLEIETFIHGAMCISYSGRCLLSNYLTGRDGNGGACSQPCRHKYKLISERNGAELPIEEHEGSSFILSSNDMCMIGHLKDLMDIGVDSFKIEGRAKNAYYAATITGAYRHAMDEILANGTVDPKWEREVFMLSHRPYATGFYYGKPGQYYETKEMLRDAVCCGTVTNCSADGWATVELTSGLPKDVQVEVLTPEEGPISVRKMEITDANGTQIEEMLLHPISIRIKLPKCVPAYSIIRFKV